MVLEEVFILLYFYVPNFFLYAYSYDEMQHKLGLVYIHLRQILKMS